MGANCKEDDAVMISYTKHLVKEMKTIEAKKYTTENVDVKFVLQLVPSDQKWLATMAGELNNAATFFSTFANESDKKATWQHWQFSDCIEKAKAVEKYNKSFLRKN